MNDKALQQNIERLWQEVIGMKSVQPIGEGSSTVYTSRGSRLIRGEYDVETTTEGYQSPDKPGMVVFYITINYESATFSPAQVLPEIWIAGTKVPSEKISNLHPQLWFKAPTDRQFFVVSAFGGANGGGSTVLARFTTKAFLPHRLNIEYGAYLYP